MRKLLHIYYRLLFGYFRVFGYVMIAMSALFMVLTLLSAFGIALERGLYPLWIMPILILTALIGYALTRINPKRVAEVLVGEEK